MAAGSMTAARRTPLIAAIPKMFMPLLVILPGMLAIGLHASRGGFLPIGSDGQPNYNLAIPMMLAHYMPSGVLGLGLTALMASFMSGMAGNVTAFNTVWPDDIYQSYIRPGRSDGLFRRDPGDFVGDDPQQDGRGVGWPRVLPDASSEGRLFAVVQAARNSRCARVGWFHDPERGFLVMR